MWCFVYLGYPFSDDDCENKVYFILLPSSNRKYDPFAIV